MMAKKLEARLAKDLFLRSLDVPTGERALFIGSDGADAAVRDAALSLLDAYVEAEALLTARTAAAGSAPPPPAEFCEQPGEQIGPYTLVEAIGEGGFGIVYRARQSEPVRRDVAIKILKPGIDSRAIAQRFEQERQTLAMMTHPGIARIFGAGTTPGGRPYFAMELVEGLPITTYCDRGRMSLRERLRLFHRVCLALQHAHQRGVIHRDIKPGNVLIVDVDGKPEPRIIDFGIAKAIGERGRDAAMTHPAQVLGTPMYMAPEQAAGGAVDTRTDVYALGVMLYELLAGVPPFDVERLETAPLPELARIIAEEEPPRPSSRVMALGDRAEPIAAVRRSEPARLGRELRGDLDHMVRCAIAKDPGERYPGVPSLAADVRRYLEHEPLEAGPASLRYRAAKFIRRHVFESVAAGAVAAAVVLLAVGAVIFALRQQENARRLEAQRTRSDAAAVFARSIFSGVDPALARGKDTELLREILGAAERRVATELAENHEAASDMLMTIGASYESIGALDRAEATFRAAIGHAEEHFGRESPRTVDAGGRLATVLTYSARYPEAIEILEPLVEQSRRIRGPQHAETLSLQMNLATIYGRAGRSADSAEELMEIYAARTQSLGPHHESTLTVGNNLALVLDDLGRIDDSIAIFRQVLEAQRETLGPDHPRTLTTAHNLGGACMEAGRADEAAALFQETLERKRRILGPSHQSTINTACTLALIWTSVERLDEAEALLLDTHAAAEAGLPADDPRWIMLLNGLGKVYLRTERLELAEPLVLRAAETMARLAGETHPDALRLRTNHAVVLLRMKRHEQCFDEARAVFDRAMAARGAADAITVDALRTMGSALRGLGRVEEARSLLTRHRAAVEADSEGGHPELARLDEALAGLDMPRDD